MDWGLSVKASKNPDTAMKYAKKILGFYRPEMLLTEKITKYSRKSPHNHSIIKALVSAISDETHREVEKMQSHPNKYDEINVLCERFPQLANWAPSKRKVWVSEHRNTILFEALAQAIAGQE